MIGSRSSKTRRGTQLLLLALAVQIASPALGAGALKPRAARKATPRNLPPFVRLHVTGGGSHVINLHFVHGAPPVVVPESAIPAAPVAPAESKPEAPAPRKRFAALKHYLVSGALAVGAYFVAHPIEISHKGNDQITVKVPGLVIDVDGSGLAEAAAPLPERVTPDHNELRPPKKPKAGPKAESEAGNREEGATVSTAEPPTEVTYVPQKSPLVLAPFTSTSTLKDKRVAYQVIQFLIENAQKANLRLKVQTTRGEIETSDPEQVRRFLVKDIQWLQKRLRVGDFRMPMDEHELGTLNQAVMDLGFRAQLVPNDTGFAPSLQILDTAETPRGP